MKKTSLHQELMLFTNTRFFTKAWALKQEEQIDKELSSKEKLKNACWNGLILELLPEACEKVYDPSLTLWQVSEADNFIELVFCKRFEKVESFFSINPYLHLENKIYN